MLRSVTQAASRQFMKPWRWYNTWLYKWDHFIYTAAHRMSCIQTHSVRRSKLGTCDFHFIMKCSQIKSGTWPSSLSLTSRLYMECNQSVRMTCIQKFMWRSPCHASDDWPDKDNSYRMETRMCVAPPPHGRPECCVMRWRFLRAAAVTTGSSLLLHRFSYTHCVSPRGAAL